MSNSRIHIDQLFAKGLENLEIPVSSNAFENIRKDVASENPESTNGNNPFENFELAVTDVDWQIIKEKLAKAIAADPINKAEASLKELELAVTDNDWQIVKDRLAQSQKQIIVPLPIENIGSSLKDFEIAVTDADWQSTKSKLNNFNKKKMVWWWWLNIVIIGSLIGLAVHYFAPLHNVSQSISTSIVSPLEAATEQNADISDKPENNSSVKENLTDNNKDNSSNETINNADETNIVEKAKDNNLTVKHQDKPISSKHESANKNSSVKQSSSSKNNSEPSIVDNKPTKETPVKTVKDALKSNTDVAVNYSDDNSTNFKKDINNEVPPTDNVVPPTDNVVPPSDLKDVIKNDVKASETDNNVTKVNNATDNINSPAINSIDTSKKKEPTAKTKITPPPIPNPGLQFYVGLVTDISKVDRILDKSNPATYNDIRNKGEKPFTQLSYGITAGLQKGKNQFQTGIQITQQNYNASYHYTLKYRDSLPYVMRPSGRVVMIPFGPLKERSVDENTHVSIQKIEMPFTYNRSWTLGANTQLITGMGGVISMNIKETGTKMLNPVNNQLYFYSALKGSERKMGFSPSINLGVQRTIGKNLALQGSVFGKYSVTNRYNNSFSMKEYPYSQDNITLTAKEHLYSYGLSIKLLYLLH